MIYLVCINHHQSGCIGHMLAATASFGARRVLVLDRSPEIAPYGWPHVVRNAHGDGWLAGRMRDLGLAYVRANFQDCTGVLFVDGDRIPQENLQPYCQGDAVLFSVVNDPRGEVPGDLCDCTEWCRDFAESPFMSPALYLSRHCIETVLEDGCLFAPCFDGLWGEEDRDLGDRVVHAGFRVLASSAAVSGTLLDRYSANGIDNRNYMTRRERYNTRIRSRKMKSIFTV